MTDRDEHLAIIERMLAPSAKIIHQAKVERRPITELERDKLDEAHKRLIKNLRGFYEDRALNKDERSLKRLNFFWGPLVQYVLDNDDRFKGRLENKSQIKEEIARWLKRECCFYNVDRIYQTETGFFKVIDMKSLSYDKTPESQVDIFFERLKWLFIREYKISPEKIRAGYLEMAVPQKFAVQNEGDLPYQRMQKRLYVEQRGLCQIALIHGTAWDLLHCVPTEIHHMIHNTISNILRYGREIIDGWANLVFVSRKFHTRYPHFFMEKKEWTMKK